MNTRCPRCDLPLTYEADERYRFTRLFSVGQNGTMNCPTGEPHTPPNPFKRTLMRWFARFENWDV